ncbi:hypothetical protein TSUD_13270 [Trifolium subterraneum]|uniref:Uncharacterized protein n=1 Tax=Trifolium subterraneum TaxID=3900 RepID=A0A2Z6PDK1_TRISU|nr:hypothetical protein TSUD_13270 [Trifolium subterraneum]
MGQEERYGGRRDDGKDVVRVNWQVLLSGEGVSYADVVQRKEGRSVVVKEGGCVPRREEEGCEVLNLEKKANGGDEKEWKGLSFESFKHDLTWAKKRVLGLLSLRVALMGGRNVFLYLSDGGDVKLMIKLMEEQGETCECLEETESIDEDSVSEFCSCHESYDLEDGGSLIDELAKK